MIYNLQTTDADIEKIDHISITKLSRLFTFINYVDVLIEKPWGYEYSIFENDSIAIWVLHIQRGFQTSLHCHLTKKTALFVLAGEAALSTLHGAIHLYPGDGVQIHKGVFHSTAALAQEVILIETETPNNKNELIRLHDKYGREGKGYADDPQIPHSDKIIGSFHKPTERYNTVKKYGDHHLTVIKCRNEENFFTRMQSAHADAMTVLRGNILDQEMRSVFSTGDLLAAHVMQNGSHYHILDDVILLLIKKDAL